MINERIHVKEQAKKKENAQYKNLLMFIISCNDTHQLIWNRQTATISSPIVRKSMKFCEPRCLHLWRGMGFSFCRAVEYWVKALIVFSMRYVPQKLTVTISIFVGYWAISTNFSIKYYPQCVSLTQNVGNTVF
jgi:hypothetical protein